MNVESINRPQFLTLTLRIMENLIESCEFYDYKPPISENFNEVGSEFTITAFNEDLVTRPSKSLLVINGTLSCKESTTTTAGATTVTDLTTIDLEKINFINNGLLYLFDRIDYYIGDAKIDSIRKPGITSTLKGLVSFEDDITYNNAGWKISPSTGKENILTKKCYFCATIPMSIVMGFFEDYTQFLYRMPQKLIFYRNTGESSNALCVKQNFSATISLKDIVWRVPQIKFSLEYETQIRKEILDNTQYEMAYRTWFYQSIQPPKGATEFTWDFPVAYSKTKYIILGFQEGKENNVNVDNSEFQLLDLENVQVMLNNNVYYPRERLNLKLSDYRCSSLYYMFNQFKGSYYGKNYEDLKPIVNYSTFLTKYPIIAIDCSHQPNVIKESLINVKIMFDWRTALSATKSTTIHCVMIADRKATYNPLNNMVIS